MDKICLTTFVYGKKYQAYIPFLLYSCHKAYPNYDFIIFVYGPLDEDIARQINYLHISSKVIIKENAFADFQNMDPLISKTLRWLLWDDSFNDYDYLYTVDIDMLYIREPIPLLEQHKQHAEFLDLPLSNMKRTFEYSCLKPSIFATIVKRLGIKHAILNFAFNRSEERLTGLHFVNIKAYYALLTAEKRQKHLLDLKKGKYLKGVGYPNNEIYLYKLVESLGLDLTGLGSQSDPVTSLDPNYPNKKEFRPHHGIHLGIFRSADLVLSSGPILNSPIYNYYIDIYESEILQDPVFNELLKISPEFIKSKFDLMHQYYKIERS